MKLLDFKKTRELLRKYKIPLIETKVIKSKREAINFAEKFGYPVVLKALAPNVLHKTEAGLVKIGIKNEKELEKAFKELKKKKDFLFLIQKKGKGIEVICGMKRDVVFGPVLMFGLGGIFVEVLKDISFGIAPFSKKEAMEMLKEVKGYKILKGYRGGNPVNLGKIGEILFQLSKLSQGHPEIKEIDLNPIFVDEKKAEVADPKFLI